MITFEGFVKKEILNLDYSSYNIPLNLDQFKHFLKTDCNLFDIHKLTLSRYHYSSSKMLLIDASKHEIRVPESRCYNYIYLHMIDRLNLWGDAPNKYRSINFFYTDKKSNMQLPMHSTYILVPFNDANLAMSDKMIGSAFGSFCRSFIDAYYYFYINRKDDPYIDFTSPDTTIKCLKKFSYDTRKMLNNIFIKKSIGGVEDPQKKLNEYIRKFKTDNLFDTLKKMFSLENTIEEINMKIFTGLKNNFVYNYGGSENVDFYDITNTKIDRNKGIKFGWTDSKVLLIDQDYYHEIKNNL